MKVMWFAVLLCIGAVLVIAVASHDPVQVPAGHAGPAIMSPPPEKSLDDRMTVLVSATTVTGQQENTALFSKYVSADTPYIIVSLYSGDPADPLSLSIITPDKTLGPFNDGSDGRIDGRIDLKINNPAGMTPGLWKFQVSSYKNISYGSLENLSWIRTGTSDRKVHE